MFTLTLTITLRLARAVTFMRTDVHANAVNGTFKQQISQPFSSPLSQSPNRPLSQALDQDSKETASLSAGFKVRVAGTNANH